MRHLPLALLLAACSGSAGSPAPGTAPEPTTTAPVAADPATVGAGTGQGGQQRASKPKKPGPIPVGPDGKPKLPAWFLADEDGNPIENPEAALAEMNKVDCKLGADQHLVVSRPAAEPADLAWEALWTRTDGTVALGSGRHQGQSAVKVAALTGDLSAAHKLVFSSCEGATFEVAAAEVARRPDRWVLVPSGKKFPKLLDLDSPDGDRRPLLRAVTLLDVR